MNLSRGRVVEVGRALVHEARVENVTFLAGSIAYHAIVSLLPLLVLVLGGLSTIGDGALRDNFQQMAESVLSQSAGDEVSRQLVSAGHSTGLSIVGLVLLVWGTLRIFRGLDTAFSDIYETEASNSFTDQMSDGLIVLATFAIAILFATIINDKIPVIDGVGGWFLARIVLVIALTATFLPMYYIFPDTDVTVAEILPGTVFAAVGLTAFEALFRFYVTHTGSANGNLVSGILVLLTWLYFSGLVILLGVVVNAVISNRSADVDITPVVGDHVPATEAERAERKQLVASIVELDRVLDGAEEFSVSVDGQTFTLPAPRRVVTDTDESLLALEDASLGIEFQWASRNE